MCFIIGIIGKGQKKQKNIQLHYVSLYIYFVPLSASAKEEIVCPTRPKFAEHTVFAWDFFLASVLWVRNLATLGGYFEK